MPKGYRGRVKYDTKSKLNRNQTIIFKVSEEEQATIKACANKYGISLSAYCRLILLNNRKILEGGTKDVH